MPARGARTPRPNSGKSSRSKAYAVRWEEQARAMLLAINDRKIQGQLIEKSESLSQAPHHQGKSLQEPLAGFRSIRMRRYRIVYHVKGKKVFIAATGIRKEEDRHDVYTLARKLFNQKLL